MRPDTGAAVLAATAQPAPAGGPSLSALASRVAAARVSSRGLPPAGGPVLTVLPSPTRGRAASTPPQRVSASPTGPARPPTAAYGPTNGPEPVTHRPACRLLAVHGGAGVSSLLRAGLTEAGAVDAHRSWPQTGPVLLVARTSVGALEHVRDAARQRAAGACADVDLLGLVLLADAPGRLPARAGALADLVCWAFPRVWLVPWLEEWRLATSSEPLPVHPEVARLCTDVRALTGARSQQQGEHR